VYNENNENEVASKEIMAKPKKISGIETNRKRQLAERNKRHDESVISGNGIIISSSIII
jgi:hypothetical protein